MKSLNIKKAAAVAAGTALLLGAALAAVPALQKGFFWDATTGNTNVQIVTSGGDAVAAGNLAAVIGHKAYVSGGTTTPTATGTAKITVKGSAAALPEASVRSDIAWNTYGSDLILGSSKGLNKGTIKFNNNEYDYEEEVEADAGLTFGYNEGTDYHGLGFTSTKPNKLIYKFKFLDVFPNPNGDLNATVTLPFLGDSYVLNKLKSTEAELIKGEKVSLGIGQQKDVTVGDKTYTVTLDSADLNEVSTTGQATVSISGGDLTSPVKVQLDTSNVQSKKAGDVLVFLQSVAKSYTPGQGGSAVLRIGGDVLTLKDGQAVDAFPGWKAEIVTATGGVSQIQLVYNKNLQAKDVASEIAGPNNYFTLKYVGDEVARGTWASEKVTVGATGSDDPALDTLTYKDFGYDDEYTLDLNDDINQTAFLAYNASAAGSYIGQGNNSAGALGYMSLEEDDVFFVYNTPVKINSMSTSDTNANAQVIFSIGYGGAHPTTKTVKASDSLCAVTNNAGVKNAACASVPIIGGNTIDFNWTSNTTAIPTLTVTAGADNAIDTEYGTITFGAGAHNAYNTTTHNLGPYNVTFVDKNSGSWTVSYMNTTNNPGITTTGINQNTNNNGDDNNKYQWTAGAWAEATDTDTIVFTNPENNPRTQRIALVRGEVEGEAGETVKTVKTGDTFPYEVTSDVTVTDLACAADAVSANIALGNVASDLVVSDAVVPTGNAIVIGGHYVNKLAVGHTEKLTAAGDMMDELSGNTLYVAGYTAADTASAVDELIAAIKAL